MKVMTTTGSGSANDLKHVVEGAELQRERLQEVFDEFDADGSGAVSTCEMVKICEALGVEKSADEISELMRVSDPDGSGNIDFEEFVKAMTGDSAGADNLRQLVKRSSLARLSQRVQDLDIGQRKRAPEDWNMVLAMLLFFVGLPFRLLLVVGTPFYRVVLRPVLQRAQPPITAFASRSQRWVRRRLLALDTPPVRFVVLHKEAGSALGLGLGRCPRAGLLGMLGWYDPRGVQVSTVDDSSPCAGLITPGEELLSVNGAGLWCTSIDDVAEVASELCRASELQLRVRAAQFW